MSLRSHLADELKERLPRTWTVKPYRYSLDAIKAPAVMLATSRFEKAKGQQGAYLSLHEHTLTLTVFVPETAPEKRQDAIDAAAEKVVVAIERLQKENSEHVRWETVTYDIEDNYPSADITLTVHTTHDYAGIPAVTS